MEAVVRTVIPKLLAKGMKELGALLRKKLRQKLEQSPENAHSLLCRKTEEWARCGPLLQIG